MYKSTTNFLRSAALTALFFVGLLSVNAAVTYHLDTHPVFDYSYTIEGTANIQAGANLLDNMPQAFWRAYTTYKFFSDAAMTQEITTAPSADATVYVDYVFDPAYIPSVEGEEPVWNFLRGYNESAENSYGNQYLLYKRHSEMTINGYKYTGLLPNAGNNYPMEKSTHCYWALYGDGFNCQIKLNDDQQEYWLIWAATSGNSNMTLGSRPEKGWQLYVNTAKNKRLPNGGTVALGVPDVANYLYNLENVNSTCQTTSLDTNKHYFDSHNNLLGRTAGSTNYKQSLWWYALFATPTMATYPNLFHVTYKVMVYDAETDTYIQEGDDIVKQKDSNNLKPSYYLTEPEGYTYIYYKDEEMTQEWGANENMPNNENTVVWVLKDQFTTTTWKTICLPVGISDPASIGMKLWEYTSVTTTKSEDKYYSFNLTFDWATEIVEDKPYLYMFDNARKSVVDQFEKRLTNGYYNDFITSGEEPIPVTMIDNSYPEVNVAMTGTFDGFTLKPQVDSTDPFYFYFGYNSKKGTYNFYPVKTKEATIKPFRCYFVAGDVPADGVLGFGMDGSTDGISQMMVSFERYETSKGVYNLNGQLMNANGSTVGLPAGIYVVNGKKVVVK